MQAIVLCGGRGERLMPLTARTSASLLRIVGKEVILYTLEQLEKAKIDRITLALGYGGERIKTFFSSYDIDNSKIQFSECEPVGTAYAIEKAYNKTDDNIIVVEGNCVFDYDITKLIEIHKQKNSMCTMLVNHSKQRENRTFVSTDENNLVTGILSDTSNHAVGFDKAVTGIYVINKSLFEAVPFSADSDFLKDVIAKAVNCSENIFAVYEDVEVYKILTPNEFLKCQGKMLDSRCNKTISLTDSNFNGCTISSPCYIGKNVSIEAGTIIDKGTVIDNGTQIKGKCRIYCSYIGENSKISQMCELENSVICKNATLDYSVKCGENSVVGENTFIGNNSEICSNSKVWADRKVPQNSFVKKKYFASNYRKSTIDEEGCFTICDIGNAVKGAMNFGMAVGSAFDLGDKLVTGYNSAHNSRFMHEAVKCGLASCGVNVLDVGECTQTQLMYASFFFGAKAGIFTQVNSHCAMKIFGSGGIPLESHLETEIELSYQSENFRLCDYSTFGQCFEADGAKLAYESFLRTVNRTKYDKLNCEIRTYDKITADVYDRVFRPLNSINGDRIVFNVNDEGKKCSAYSGETGNVSWDKLSALGIAVAFEYNTDVSVAYTYPSVADIIAEKQNGRLYRYYNSSNGITDAEARKIASCPNNLFLRDGLVLCGLICDYLNRKKISLGQALRNIPDIYSTQRFVSFNGDYGKLFNEISVRENENREGAVVEKRNSRAIIRPLKNGNGIMIFAESKSCELASSLCDEISEKIKRLNSL